MEIIERSEAIKLGLKRYYTGEPCKNGHVHERSVANYGCLECQRLKMAAKDRTEANRKWNAENREKRNATSKAWQQRNPEYFQERRRERYKKHPAYYKAMAKERKYLRSRQMPPWADKKLIREFYVEAERLTRETGVPHHVDHIYPLKGERCCGLHVETNLQILTGVENMRKGNMMPEEWAELRD